MQGYRAECPGCGRLEHDNEYNMARHLRSSRACARASATRASATASIMTTADSLLPPVDDDDDDVKPTLADDKPAWPAASSHLLAPEDQLSVSAQVSPVPDYAGPSSYSAKAPQPLAAMPALQDDAVVPDMFSPGMQEMLASFDPQDFAFFSLNMAS